MGHEKEHLAKDPAKSLTTIECEDEQTLPLTPSQFDKLMEVVSHYDEERRREEDKFGAELKALFLVMRWTGLRITDALMLPRRALVENRLKIKPLNAELLFTDKSGAPLELHSHMLRGTFTVEMLLAGVPLESVNKMIDPETSAVVQGIFMIYAEGAHLRTASKYSFTQYP